MSDIAIRCQGLGKRYQIGERERYKSLRDTIADTITAPFRHLRSMFDGTSGSGANRQGDNTFWALKDLSFEVKRGEVVGVIGQNGAGKSTLLKILSRITTPTEGEVEIRGRVGSLLEVGTGFHPELTGRDNIYLNGAILGMRRAEIARKFDEIVAFAEIEQFIDTPVKRYSSGMYVRLAFAVAAHLEPEILVVDEVLAVGDAAFQKKSLGKMNEVARQGRTVLFVSHNMGAVSRLCSTGMFLDAGAIAFRGNVKEVIDYHDHELLSLRGSNKGQSHIIYNAPEDMYGAEFFVSKIEVLDIEGKPKPIVSTWDDVVFRIWYQCRRPIQRGSVILEIGLLGGAQLMLLSTQPDGTLPLTFGHGEQCVDCVFEGIQLAAGNYVVGTGLAIPGAEWLWRETELCELTITPRDVYASGLAPSTVRTTLAPQHHWRKVE